MRAHLHFRLLLIIAGIECLHSGAAELPGRRRRRPETDTFVPVPVPMYNPALSSFLLSLYNPTRAAPDFWGQAEPDKKDDECVCTTTLPPCQSAPATTSAPTTTTAAADTSQSKDRERSQTTPETTEPASTTASTTSTVCWRTDRANGDCGQRPSDGGNTKSQNVQTDESADDEASEEESPPPVKKKKRRPSPSATASSRGQPRTTTTTSTTASPPETSEEVNEEPVPPRQSHLRRPAIENWLLSRSHHQLNHWSALNNQQDQCPEESTSAGVLWAVAGLGALVGGATAAAAMAAAATAARRDGRPPPSDSDASPPAQKCPTTDAYATRTTSTASSGDRPQRAAAAPAVMFTQQPSTNAIIHAEGCPAASSTFLPHHHYANRCCLTRRPPPSPHVPFLGQLMSRISAEEKSRMLRAHPALLRQTCSRDPSKRPPLRQRVSLPPLGSRIRQSSAEAEHRRPQHTWVRVPSEDFGNDKPLLRNAISENVRDSTEEEDDSLERTPLDLCSRHKAERRQVINIARKCLIERHRSPEVSPAAPCSRPARSRLPAERTPESSRHGRSASMEARRVCRDSPPDSPDQRSCSASSYNPSVQRNDLPPVQSCLLNGRGMPNNDVVAFMRVTRLSNQQQARQAKRDQPTSSQGMRSALVGIRELSSSHQSRRER